MRAMIVAVTAVLLGLLASSGTPRSDASIEDGFRALHGDDASSYTIPGDMRLVRGFELDALGVHYERYQQYFGAVPVLGGEITIIRDRGGDAVGVIGAHYATLRATNTVRRSVQTAELAVRRDVGSAYSRSSRLVLDPHSRRYLYEVESRGFTGRWFHYLDAETGVIVRSFNAIDEGEGTGVKDDTKDLTDLTVFHATAGHGVGGPHYDLVSADARQVTYDAENGNSILYPATDLDDTWDLDQPFGESPGQAALVDAHYYANATDDYFQSTFGLDWVGDCGYAAMLSVAHFQASLNNAFWNGTFTVYGNGDGLFRREYSGALDIVAHEHTHGVTECTSGLDYEDHPGALNEAFSDILGSSAEFFVAEPETSICTKASGQTTCDDWWIGEDIDLTADAIPGFRNMADPEEDGNPDHYSEYVVTTEDNGGVHTNSSIASHAYYLLVNGGLNASCAQSSTHSSTHCTDLIDIQDNNLSVTGIGITDAEQIAFLGFTSLQADASFCDARLAGETAAAVLFGAGSQQETSTHDAWVATGVTDLACGSVFDTDDDGIVDAGDNCPGTPNPDQADFDSDGAGDVCDGDIDGDGLLNGDDAEADGDGFSNEAEAACGSDPLHSLRIPERIDSPFNGLDDDGDGDVDEPLPPGAAAFDCDGDGFTGTAEDHVFAGAAGRDQDPCGTSSWPNDIASGSIPKSTDRVNIVDLSTFVAPVRYLNTDVGTLPGDERWDLVPGPGQLGADINVLDLSASVSGETGYPPMLGGSRALGGPDCPWP